MRHQVPSTQERQGSTKTAVDQLFIPLLARLRRDFVFCAILESSSSLSGTISTFVSLSETLYVSIRMCLSTRLPKKYVYVYVCVLVPLWGSSCLFSLSIAFSPSIPPPTCVYPSLSPCVCQINTQTNVGQRKTRGGSSSGHAQPDPVGRVLRVLLLCVSDRT